MRWGREMTYIVTSEWVKEQGEKVVIVDVRFSLQDADFGARTYARDHIENAFYFDLNKDLSSLAKEHGGNHPLPDIVIFSKLLGETGINQETPVVFYDVANDMFAARAWWLLHYLGHKKVYVLDGGYQAWQKAGYGVTAEVPGAIPTIFEVDILSDRTVSMEEVRNLKADSVLIDSRAFNRYTGEVEPMYPKPGHIPGAVNYFWKNVLDETGNWKNPAQLTGHFADLDKSAEVIVSCGSGVSACPNIIALKMTGFENVKLYPGSFSDWISYEENEVVTGE